MKFEQMYSTMFYQCDDNIALVGRPGIGKTQIAIKIAANYVEKTDKSVLYITGMPIGWFYEKINELSQNIKNKIIISGEIYKYISDDYLIYKIDKICSSEDNIGLVIFDDDQAFNFNYNFLSQCKYLGSLDTETKVLFVANLPRKSERHRKCMPKLKDVSKDLVKETSGVFAIYRESYYYYETKPNASDEEEFIRLKKI